MISFFHLHKQQRTISWTRDLVVGDVKLAASAYNLYGFPHALQILIRSHTVHTCHCGSTTDMWMAMVAVLCVTGVLMSLEGSSLSPNQAHADWGALARNTAVNVPRSIYHTLAACFGGEECELLMRRE